MNPYDINAFDNIYIYEFSERYNNTYIRETIQNFTIRETIFDAIFFNSYIVNSPLTNYICFKIRPNRNAFYYIIRIKVEDYKDDEKSDSDIPETNTSDIPEIIDSDKPIINDSDTSEIKRKEKSESKSFFEKNSLILIISGCVILSLIIIVIIIYIIKNVNKSKGQDLVNIDYSPIQPN